MIIAAGTFQIIGAFIDSVLMLIFGMVFLIWAHKLIGKEGSPEQIAKRTKIGRIAGALLVISGLGMFIIDLLEVSTRNHP
jgi:TRAP-type C4-dicarboxylate transport system permease small subunit